MFTHCVFCAGLEVAFILTLYMASFRSSESGDCGRFCGGVLAAVESGETLPTTIPMMQE